ncbi:MAG: hypothetical protein ACOYNZ_12765 [Rhodoferax sp.]
MAWQIGRRTSIYVLACLCLAALASSPWWPLHVQRPPLVLAPMMDLTPCLLASPGGSSGSQPDWLAPCSGPQASSAHLVESTLRHLQPNASAAAGLQLGYTLQVPLLALLLADQDAWRVNTQALDNIARTVSESTRPVVLYLFSTHFGVNAPIEPVLARNPANIAQTQQGPLPVDTYYGMPIYPWSVARTDNPITQYRVKVIQALTQRICQLPENVRSRIHGITLLGEVHQLFPNFQSGMGFTGPYLVSDYSPASVAGFRQYLQGRFSSLQALNQQLGSDYPSFEAITPPAKDIRREPLSPYHEHMDAYAAGRIPITGWVHVPDSSSAAKVVKIYLDGRHIVDAPVQLSRQDVRAARPEFNTADVGWRFDLDYSELAAGLHRIDLALSQPGQALIQLGSRSFTTASRQQQAHAAATAAPLPAMQSLPERIAAYTDEPRDQASYYYNPLAREWQLFREAQVLHYLQYFNTLIAKSCLSDAPRYTHQIVPQFNPGWDSGKYAADASLQPMKGLRTGVSLYGEASYGRSFGDWFKQSPHEDYGITEFHPLQAMSPLQLGDLFKQHRDSGARFLSFFLETRWQDRRVSSAPNLFAFDPENRQHASDQLYNSIKAVLRD